MGNRLQGLTFTFNDSNWKNSLAVVTTNVEAEIGNDGDVVINSPNNGTDVVGRSTRDVSFSVENDALYWEGKVADMIHLINTEQPLCRMFLDTLFWLNLVMFTMNIFLYGE